MTRMPGLALGAAALLALGAGPAFADDATPAATTAQELTIEFTGQPEVTVSEPIPAATAGGEETQEFTGRYRGHVTGDEVSLIAGTEVACEFAGIAAPGRAFSCGFTIVEQVQGRCVFTADKGDSAIAEWTCRTAATMTSDARCEGKATWTDGTGKFAGIAGDARFHSDLFLQPGKGFAKWRGSWRVPSMAALQN